MKKIVLIDASQRKRANSEIIVDEIAKMLPDVELQLLNLTIMVRL